MTNKHIGQSIDEHIAEKRKTVEFASLFEKEKLISDISQRVYKLRINAGLSQKEIADKAQTTQPVIARLESGKDSRVPSLELLSKIAHAVHKEFKVSFL